MQLPEKIPYGDIVDRKFLHFDDSTGLQISGTNLIIEDPASLKRLSIVLRTRPGDEFVFVIGAKGYAVRIEAVTRKNISCTLQGLVYGPPELMDVSFILSPVKNFNLYEHMISYLVQLGVSEISFLATERTLCGVSENKLSRLRSIAGKHAEISKSVYCPVIRSIDFEELRKWSNIFVLHTQASTEVGSIDLNHLLSRDRLRNSVFISGPEGGFSDRDIERFRTVPKVSFIRIAGGVFKAESIPVYIASICHYLGT